MVGDGCRQLHAQRGELRHAAVGTGKTVTVSGLTLTGAAAGNYALAATTATTTATITAPTVTPAVVAANKAYDGPTARRVTELHAERPGRRATSSAARRHGELRQRRGRHRQDGDGERPDADGRGGRQLRALDDDGDDDGDDHRDDGDAGGGRGEQGLRRHDGATVTSCTLSGLVGARRRQLHAQRGELRHRGGRHRQDGDGERPDADGAAAGNYALAATTATTTAAITAVTVTPAPGRGQQGLRRPDRRDGHRAAR